MVLIIGWSSEMDYYYGFKISPILAGRTIQKGAVNVFF